MIRNRSNNPTRTTSTGVFDAASCPTNGFRQSNRRPTYRGLSCHYRGCRIRACCRRHDHPARRCSNEERFFSSDFAGWKIDRVHAASSTRSTEGRERLGVDRTARRRYRDRQVATIHHRKSQHQRGHLDARRKRDLFPDKTRRRQEHFYLCDSTRRRRSSKADRTSDIDLCIRLERRWKTDRVSRSRKGRSG